MFKYVRRLLLPVTLAAGAAALVDAAIVEPRLVKVKNARIPLRPGDDTLAGVRIAHLSDLHVMGRGWKPGTTREAIEAINEADVDLVAITGDFVGGGRGADLIMKLMSDLRTDVPAVAVFGNHDHVYGRRRLEVVERSLSRLGIIVLNNDVVPVDLPSGRIWVGGVDDAYSQREDLDRVLRLFGGVEGPRLLLTHYPDLAQRLKPGQVDLSLAGHSHGGQIRIPVLAAMMHRAHARTKYGKGLFCVNGNPLYVSAGIGMSGIPMRFLNPPEIPIIHFVQERVAAREACEGDPRVAILV